MTPQDLSRLQRNLPSFPGIQEKEHFFNSAVLIPFWLQAGEYHFIFQKRAVQIRQGGEICFPGGAHEPERDDSYEATAIRETMEEFGLTRAQIQILGFLDVLIAPMGTTIDPFLGLVEINSLDDLHLDPNEVEHVFSLPVSYFEQTKPQEYAVRLELHPTYIDANGQEQVLLPVEELGLPPKYAHPWSGKSYRIIVYNTEEGVIWGLTAKMIDDVVQKLKQESYM